MSINRVQLLLSGISSPSGYVKLYDNEPISVKYAISDVNDITKKTGPASQNFTIPGTPENNILFGEIFNIGSDGSFNTNVKTPATLFVNTIPIMTGIFQLTDVTINKDTNAPDSVVYAGTLYSNFSDLLMNIGDNFINQLNWNDLNHTYSYSAITNSWTAGTSNGYVYPMIDYGFDFDLGTTNINNPSNIGPTSINGGAGVFNFFPATYVSEIVKRIFQGSGYQVNISDPQFEQVYNRLIIPYNTSNTLQEPFQFITGRTFEAQITRNEFTFILQNASPLTYVQYPFSGVVFDNGNLYEPSISTYSSDTYSNQTFTVTYTAQLSTGVTLNTVSNFGIKTQLYVQGFDVANATVYFNANYNAQTVSYTFPSQFLRPGNVVHILSAPFVTLRNVLDTATFTILSSGTYWSNTVSPQVIEGQTIDFQGFVPQNTKQIDILTSLSQMFNLWFVSDPYIPNQINISPRDYYMSSGTIVDWSDKLDINTPIQESFLSEQQPHQIDFTYAADDDYYNTNYAAIVKLNYGEALYTFSNLWTKDVQQVGPAFSPTPVAPVINASNNFVIPKMLTLNTSTNPGTYGYTNTNIRICQYNFRQLSASDNWFFESRRQTGYPYCGMLDDPFTGTTDLSYSAVSWTYYVTSSITQNNLLNVYYQGYLDQISDPNAKMVTAEFYLDETDINNLRFNDQIFVEKITNESGYYYYLNSVSYDPVTYSTATVELIKIPNPFYKYINQITSLTNNNNGQIGISTVANVGVNNTINGSNTAVIGGNNVITSLASNTLVNGNNNIIQGEVSFVHGLSNDIEGGNSVSAIIGDNNLIDFGGSGNTIFGTHHSINRNNINSSILGGSGNTIGSFGLLNVQIGGDSNIIDSGNTLSNTFGGQNNYIPPGLTGVTILGSSGLTATTSNMSYVDNLTVTNTFNGAPASAITSLISGSTIWIADSNVNIISLSGSNIITGKNNLNGIIAGGSGNTIITASSATTSYQNSILNGSNNIMYMSGSTDPNYGIPLYSQYNSITGGNNNTISGTTFIGTFGNGPDFMFGNIILGGSNSSLIHINNGTNVGGHFLNYNSILNGYQNYIGDVYNGLNDSQISGNTIMGGEFNLIGPSSFGDSIIGGYSNYIISSLRSSILGGRNNTISTSDHSTSLGGYNNLHFASHYSSIVGGLNNYLNNTYQSVILGGNGITGTSNNTAYAQNLIVSGYTYNKPGFGATQLLAAYTVANGNPINMNTTADTIVSLMAGNNFVITDIVLTNVSATPTTAADMEWWTGTGRTGTQLFESANGLELPFTNLTSSIGYFNTTYFPPPNGGNNGVYKINNTPNILSPNVLYVSLGTAEGTALTIDMYMYGYPIN